MRFLSFACTLLTLLLGSYPSHAQELKDLHQVSIVIEKLGDSEKRVGLTEEALQSQTLVALKRDLPRLEVKEDAIPFLYVNTIATRVHFESGGDLGTALCLSIQLKRSVMVLNDDRRVIGGMVTTVWETGTLLVGSSENMASRVRDKINDLMTQFAAAYYRQNPHCHF